MAENSHSNSSLSDVRIIEFPKHTSSQGKLSVAENGAQSNLPFSVRRVYYLYDVPSDSERGGHSHIESESLIVAVAGAFEVELDDGTEKRRWRLDRPYIGLFVPKGVWRVIDNFSGGAVCMVLTSALFSEEDYIRDYEEFRALTSSKRK